MMGEIYSKAERVVVWLRTNPADDKLLEYVNIYRVFCLWQKEPFVSCFQLPHTMRTKLENKLENRLARVQSSPDCSEKWGLFIKTRPFNLC